MDKQLISITPYGEMVGLQTKKGKGIDLRQFGKAEIKRSSIIEWDNCHQKWFIRMLPEGYELTTSVLMGVGSRFLFNHSEDGDIAYFDDYEDAVKVEIAYIQETRKAKGLQVV